MTQAELKTLIKKIQNRCSLEDVSKVTYYWNSDHKIVFKLFFESLFLPEELRVESPKLQNTFLTQNVYEYTDDFKILSLNQDEGFIEVLPDNQDFNIINSYKDSNEKDVIQDSRIRLAGKNLNEAFAKSKKYILHEDENIATEEAVSEKASEDKKAKLEPPEKTNAFVIGIQMLPTSAGTELLKKAISDAQTVEQPVKLCFGVPNAKKYPGFTLDCIRTFGLIAEESVGQPTFAYYMGEGNTKGVSLFSELKNSLQNVYAEPSDSSEQVMIEANYKNVVNVYRTTNQVFDDVKDSTIDIFNQAEDLAKKLVTQYEDLVIKKGGLKARIRTSEGLTSKEVEKAAAEKYKAQKNTLVQDGIEIKSYERLLQAWEASKNDPQTVLACHFCADVYDKDDDASAKDQHNARKENLSKWLAGPKIDNIGNVKHIDMGTIFKASIANYTAEVLASTSDDISQSANNGMFTNNNQAGASAALKSEKPDKLPEQQYASDYPGDFYAWLIALGGDDFIRLKQLFDSPNIAGLTLETDFSIKKEDLEDKEDSSTEEQAEELSTEESEETETTSNETQEETPAIDGTENSSEVDSTQEINKNAN